MHGYRTCFNTSTIRASDSIPWIMILAACVHITIKALEGNNTLSKIKYKIQMPLKFNFVLRYLVFVMLWKFGKKQARSYDKHTNETAAKRSHNSSVI